MKLGSNSLRPVLPPLAVKTIVPPLLPALTRPPNAAHCENIDRDDYFTKPKPVFGSAAAAPAALASARGPGLQAATSLSPPKVSPRLPSLPSAFGSGPLPPLASPGRGAGGASPFAAHHSTSFDRSDAAGSPAAAAAAVPVIPSVPPRLSFVPTMLPAAVTAVQPVTAAMRTASSLTPGTSPRLPGITSPRMSVVGDGSTTSPIGATLQKSPSGGYMLVQSLSSCSSFSAAPAGGLSPGGVAVVPPTIHSPRLSVLATQPALLNAPVRPTFTAALGSELGVGPF